MDSKSWAAQKKFALAQSRGAVCEYCRAPVILRGDPAISRATLDHKVPISRGGSNHHNNLALSCVPCNADKGNLTVEEWDVVKTFRTIHGNPYPYLGLRPGRLSDPRVETKSKGLRVPLAEVARKEAAHD